MKKKILRTKDWMKKVVDERINDGRKKSRENPRITKVSIRFVVRRESRTRTKERIDHFLRLKSDDAAKEVDEKMMKE